MVESTIKIDAKLKNLNLFSATLIVFVDKLDEKQSEMQE